LKLWSSLSSLLHPEHPESRETAARPETSTTHRLDEGMGKVGMLKKDANLDKLFWKKKRRRKRKGKWRKQLKEKDQRKQQNPYPSLSQVHNR